MDTKSLRVEVKDADRGEVTAVFSTFDVVDSDGDVTLRGAFADGAPVRISAYGHKTWEGALPVGKGVIRTTDTEAILEGRFFLNTTTGRDTFEVVKELGGEGLQEWSYGYDVDDAEPSLRNGRKVRLLKSLVVHEVSPVLIGAGVNTRTLSAKSHMKFADEGEAVLAALAKFGERAADVMAMRREKGKGLSPESAGLLEQVRTELKRLDDLLGQTSEPSVQDDVTHEFLRSVARRIA